MPTYKIIGADQKEYGPITGDQIRQWIKESRVNGQTRARSEGDLEWKPLSTFPEFADVLTPGLAAAPPPVAAAIAQGNDARETAAQTVKGPAIALIVTAALNLVFGFFQLIKLTVGKSAMEVYSGIPQLNDPQMQKMLRMAYGPVGVASTGFEMAVAVLILIGALKMQALSNYSLAMTAAILAVLPCITPCCGIITLPFGIWALVALNKPGVKSQFT